MWWFLGSLGIVAIEASYVPQIARLFRIKRADDVSLFFPSLNAAGRVLALAYSVLSHQPVFVVGFMVGLVLRLTLLAQVIWYRKLAKRRQSVEARGASAPDAVDTHDVIVTTTPVHP